MDVPQSNFYYTSLKFAKASYGAVHGEEQSFPYFDEKCFPGDYKTYNLRNAPTFKVSNTQTVYNGTETISSDDIKQSKSLAEFEGKT